jgi:hypothetical protein
MITFERGSDWALPYPSIFIIHNHSPIRCSDASHHSAYISVNEPGVWRNFSCFVMSKFRYSE